MAEKKNFLELLRAGKAVAGKAVDKAMNGIDRFLGPSGKAWFANGLDELRQAVALGNGQVQAGNNPGLWGTITTGEATAERMGGDKQKALQMSYEVPKENILQKLRGSKMRVKEPQKQREQGHEM